MKIVITAGATREMLDPLRFLSNLSTGKMGYTLAETAQKKGHKVTLISAPTNLKTLPEIKFVSVKSALEMQSAVEKYFSTADCLIMTAAVADYRPQRIAKQKIKKGRNIVLKLKQNPDILFVLGKKKSNKILVGFSLTSQNWIEDGRRKLIKKNLDFIVVNKITKTKSPFGENKISGAILDRDGSVENFNNIKKEEVSKILFRKIEKMKKISDKSNFC